MTARENLTRTIEFGGPEYLPCRIAVDFDWIREKDHGKRERIRQLAGSFPDGVLAVEPAGFNVPRDSEAGERQWEDEWGTGWLDDGHGSRTVSHPLDAGYGTVASYTWPDPYRTGRFDSADRELALPNDRYVRASVWFTLFERLWMLRGFEHMLMDPYTDEVEFQKLRDHVVEYNLAIIDEWIRRGVDAVFFSDDWGCQRGLLMDPGDWRRFYRSSYALMFNRVRAGGAHVWMHLCGDITSILPDLIDIGLNVLNPVQPQAMDVRQLSRDFGGRVCFNGGVDVQGTLVRGTPEDVKREVHELVSLFGAFDGGYIGGTSHSIMPETPLDNIIALYEAFAEYQPGVG